MGFTASRRWFKEPLDTARHKADADILDASVASHGAEERTRKALARRDQLREFVRHLNALRQQPPLVAKLPQIFVGRRFLPTCRVLEVGPWRGVFHVDRDDPALVVGVEFSQEPHRSADLLRDVLDELLAADGEAESG